MVNFYHLLFLSLFAQQCSAQSLPDYWKGKISTSKNGTMKNPVPFKIYGSNREFNIKDSTRDEEVQAALLNVTVSLPNSRRNPTNEPPVNKTGQVRKSLAV